MTSEYCLTHDSREDNDMAFDMRYGVTITVALFVIEILFWLFVGRGFFRYLKKRKNH
jgi:hypothetical protein